MVVKTAAELRQWITLNGSRVEEVVRLEEFAKSERKRVDAYTQPIWDQFGFGQPTPDKAYLIDGRDEDLQKFYEATYAANAAHGWTGQYDHCPALTAENNFIKKQAALVEEFFGCEIYKPELIRKGFTLLVGAWKMMKKEAKAIKALAP